MRLETPHYTAGVIKFGIDSHIVCIENGDAVPSHDAFKMLFHRGLTLLSHHIT